MCFLVLYFGEDVVQFVLTQRLLIVMYPASMHLFRVAVVLSMSFANRTIR